MNKDRTSFGLANVLTTHTSFIEMRRRLRNSGREYIRRVYHNAIAVEKNVNNIKSRSRIWRMFRVFFLCIQM